MAGKVARLVYNPAGGDGSNLMTTEPFGHWNMDQHVVIEQLRDPSDGQRQSALENLKSTVRRNGGRLPYNDPVPVFQGLAIALADPDWDFKTQCINLIRELIPNLGDSVDVCISIILPKLVPVIGESKITVRRAVIQTLHICMKNTNDVQDVLRVIARHGIDNADRQVRKEMVVSLPMLLTPEFQHENFVDVVNALAKRLLDNSSDASLEDPVLLSLGKIRELVGEKSFDECMQKLSAPLRRFYYKKADVAEPMIVTTPLVAEENKRNSAFSFSSHSPHPVNNAPGMLSQTGHSNVISTPHQTGTYEFGVVPSHIMTKLHDQSSFTVRGQAVEQLKQVIKDLQDTRPLLPHMLHFISFLNNLLDDSNFKITTVALDIMGLLVQKLGNDVKIHLKPLISAVTKRMDDNKIVMRQAILKVIMLLMNFLTPKPVLSVICENLSHRNSRVRQETLNVLIASLLTFPSYDFDLGDLCQRIAPSLLDPKRQVRQAAMECFATLAQAMGSGKLAPLVQAVDGVELGSDGEGAMAAVQARLARRQLPRLNSSGLVDYATPTPSSATGRGATRGNAQGADIEWILAASSGSGGSARSSHSDVMELESVTSSARSTPSSLEPTPRRYRSAGRGKGKLPWEDEARIDNKQGMRADHTSPMRPRNTWSQEDHLILTNDQTTPNGVPKRLRQIKEGSRSRDQSPDQGSYRQQFINKYKKPAAENQGESPEPSSGSRNSVNGVGARRPADLQVRSSFSNSWPEPRMFEEAGKPLRRTLDPISAPDTPSPGFGLDWDDPNEPRGRDHVDYSLIPTKPALARSSSSRRKVPPIPPNSREDATRDSARDSVLDNEYDEDMERTLRPIRNSASKKKAEKLFRGLSRSPSPHSDPLDESGIFSNYSTLRLDDENHNDKQIRGKNESPFDSRPRLPRKQSDRSPKSEETTAQMDFSPFSGVTFRENRSSDVAIVGKGYKEDAHVMDAKPSGPFSKPRERRRMAKGPGLVSPLGMASQHATGPYDTEEEGFADGVVGKGMFDTNNDILSNQTPPSEKRERRQSRSDQEHRDPPRGIYGVGVSSIERQSSEENEDEDDDVSIISISKTTRARAAQKQQQKQKEAELIKEEQDRQKKEEEERQKRREEERRIRERERRQREEERRAEEEERKAREREREREERLARKQREDERKAKEKQRQQERLKKVTPAIETVADDMGLSISGSPNNKPPSGRSPPAATPPQKKRQLANGTSSHDKSPSSGGSPLSASLRSGSDLVPTEDLKPLNDPDQALRTTLKKLESEDWETKCDALLTLRRLTAHHVQTLLPQLHTIVLAVVKEIRNLRSQVSRMAIVCMGDMYLYLRKTMDPELDQTAKVLLAKTGESNGFIREDVDHALAVMVDSVTPQRALVAIVLGGASHKNQAVRRSCAQYLTQLVEKMGPGKVLSGVKDITDKVLPTAAQFMTDGSPETRYNGQKIFFMLMSHPDFDKMVNKYVPANTLRNVQDKLDNLKRKGLGDPPAESTSARARRSGQGSRSGSSTRNNSATSAAENGPSAPGSSRQRISHVRTDEATQENIKQMTTMMGANDWRERHQAINRFQEMVDSHPAVVGAHIVKIFDKFTPCLKDSNSKVNLQALKVMNEVTPALHDYMGSVVNLVTQTITSNLSSKNSEIYNAACNALDALMEHLDPTQLLQPFCNQAQSGNVRIKPDMIDRVAFLAQEVYPRKPKQVMLHVVPLLYNLIGGTSNSGASAGSSGNIRSATVKLAQTLYGLMGRSLQEHASTSPNMTPKHLHLLEGLLDSP